MHIGVPRERRADEYRVGLTPAGVQLLTAAGHVCSVEHDAGRGAGFSDFDYEKAGGRIVYSAEEAYGRADVVFKVEPLTPEEAGLVREDSVLMGFLHLAAGLPSIVRTLTERRVTAIAYESVQEDDGTLPVLVPLSQVAGKMAPQVAAALLRNDRGGNGILLGGVPGVPPARV
ncbi:MAG TPA: alanine dehydrogenase, partial [Candidatus Rokubacteria bacterium]|nr:alanine dehydrogenase [Candidatus Rokubacteria bacterium]